MSKRARLYMNVWQRSVSIERIKNSANWESKKKEEKTLTQCLQEVVFLWDYFMHSLYEIEVINDPLIKSFFKYTSMLLLIDCTNSIENNAKILNESKISRKFIAMMIFVY